MISILRDIMIYSFCSKRMSIKSNKVLSHKLDNLKALRLRSGSKP